MIVISKYFPVLLLSHPRPCKMAINFTTDFLLRKMLCILTEFPLVYFLNGEVAIHAYRYILYVAIFSLLSCGVLSADKLGNGKSANRNTYLLTIFRSEN